MSGPIDLRDFRWMEFDIVALKNSRFFSSATGDEFKAAFALWMAAFHQVPAGTLPNDERWLCSQAGYGQDQVAWAKVRAMALYGFKLGPDGLLHHAVVETKALHASTRRAKNSQHGRKAALKRWSTKRKLHTNFDDARALPEQCSAIPRDRTLLLTEKKPPKAPRSRGVGLTAEQAALFEVFWVSWPVKQGKEPGKVAFAQALNRGAAFEDILAGVKRYTALLQRPDAPKPKYPQGWLNDSRWQDEIPTGGNVVAIKPVAPLRGG